MTNWKLAISEEVTSALANPSDAVVALESTLIAHGLPWPQNLETALEAEEAVRGAGAVPATIAILEGVPAIGLTRTKLEDLAKANSRRHDAGAKEIVRKASRRDLAVAIAQGATAATTVSGTMVLASLARIHHFATGGIGGAHRPPAPGWDISADLQELARTPMLVVCAGAKSILDLPRTLEMLETLGVPVVGYRTNKFPEFYTAGGKLPVSARVDSPSEAAAVFMAHRQLGGGGVLLANPLNESDAVPLDEFTAALEIAERDAATAGVAGAALTPYLLGRLADLTQGKTLRANRALIVANARLAADVAMAEKPRKE